MKKILLIPFLLFLGFSIRAQIYMGTGAGMATQTLNGDRPVFSFNVGFQQNDILFTNSVISVEYNHKIINSYNPIYMGGRAGVGYQFNNLSIVGLYGWYYRKKSTDFGKGYAENYWMKGSYGIRAVARQCLVFEVSKVEFYQGSIGIVYYFE